MTAMPPPVPQDAAERLETALWHEALRYFRGAICCGNCARYFAMLTVEHAAGRRGYQARLVCNGRHGRDVCTERARAAWPGRPRKGHEESGAAPESGGGR